MWKLSTNKSFKFQSMGNNVKIINKMVKTDSILNFDKYLCRIIRLIKKNRKHVIFHLLSSKMKRNKLSTFIHFYICLCT
jgi:hypothetical protein